MGVTDLEPGEIRLDRDESRDRDSKNRGRDRHEDGGKDRRKEERHRDKEKDKARNRDKEKDRENKDSGNVREKERERGKDRDRDRDRDREKDKEKVRERDRGKEEEKEKEKDREKPRDREKERDKLKEKEKSRNRDKERDKDGERNREREKDKSKDRERSLDRDEKSKSRDKDNRDIGRDDAPKEKSSELREKILKMKEERLKEKEEENDSEVLSWVSKSRKLEEKRNAEREKAIRRSEALEEQDKLLAGSDDDDDDEDEWGNASRGDHLAGVKVLHGLDKVMEGGAVVLTLKDQSILAGDDINEDVDMLENVEIGEQKRRDDLYQSAKKKTGIYDDKFSDDTGIKKPMLPQYDDPVEDEGVTLDEGGRFSGEAEKKLEELRRRIEGSSSQKPSLDLTAYTKSSSEYYTSEEMLRFKKPKKKKSLRKKEKLDLDALEAEAIASGLGRSDLGSRKDTTRLAAKSEQEKADAEARKNAYQAAIEKAEAAASVIREGQVQTVGKIEEGDGGENEPLVFGDDYEDLQRSVEQARKLAVKKEEKNDLDILKAAVPATEKKVEWDIEGEAAEGGKVIITEMEEFVWGLQMKEETLRPETEDVFMDVDSEPETTQQIEDMEVTGWSEVKESESATEPLPKEEKDEITPDEIIHEAAVGKGLSGALKLLKERGTLNEGIDWGGRTMDKKKSKLVGLVEEPAPKEKEIRIERTDEFGRIMTPKEAFRALSHKFHGKGPGKMKQEKRMKKFYEDLKTKQMRDSDTPLHSMEKMREAQARMKTPYLVLSGNVKPGQTSDPSSGFATVEKDVGSLTPMLGDRKVEHFLGIKRNANAAGMPPPPPPKKSKN